MVGAGSPGHYLNWGAPAQGFQFGRTSSRANLLGWSRSPREGRSTMLIKRDQGRKLRGEDIPASEITAERFYLDRRAFIAGAAALALAPSGARAENHLA